MSDPDGGMDCKSSNEENATVESRVHTVGDGVRVIVARGARSYKTSPGSAELKLQRAKEHFSEFCKRLQEYYDQAPWKFKPVRDGLDLALVLEYHSPVPDSLALIAGDLLFNLRAALDCIVIELAELGLGSLGRAPSDHEERSLSFPIGESRLSARKRALLKSFLSAETVQVLELLQPAEIARRSFEEQGYDPDSITDELVADHAHVDLLLRLATLNNWDKHRRLTFSFLVPQGVSDGSETGTLEVVSGPGELADLRDIPWLGLDKPQRIVIDDPDVLADMQRQLDEHSEPNYHFHFSWWPPIVGDEIGRYIPFPGCESVPDIKTEASLRLVLFEPDLFQRGERLVVQADRLLAELIQEVEFVLRIVREPLD